MDTGDVHAGTDPTPSPLPFEPVLLGSRSGGIPHDCPLCFRLGVIGCGFGTVWHQSLLRSAERAGRRAAV